MMEVLERHPPAPADAWSMPLAEIDVSNPNLYAEDRWQPFFARLRREDPVHYLKDSVYGPFWSITRFRDIMQVEIDHETFSSDDANGGVTLQELPRENARPTFIRMDPPKHSAHRRTVLPAMAPSAIARLQTVARERTARVLDELPRNEEFDWVSRVSIELTSVMLATLFDYPMEDRHRLIRWSNIATYDIRDPEAEVHTEAERYQEMLNFGEHIGEYWDRRAAEPPRADDLISLLAHGEATRDFDFLDRMGVLLVLLGGGNDTSRNSMSGGIWAFHNNPDEWQKLRANPSLVPDAVQETIRYQTPVLYMRRTATRDVEVGGKLIRKGDRVALWYISGNFDESEFEEPERFVVGRRKARQHVSFGAGIHRCVGARIAEMQIRILWEEVLKRDLKIEVTEAPVYSYNNLFRNITSLKARIRG